MHPYERRSVSYDTYEELTVTTRAPSLTAQEASSLVFPQDSELTKLPNARPNIGYRGTTATITRTTPGARTTAVLRVDARAVRFSLGPCL